MRNLFDRTWVVIASRVAFAVLALSLPKTASALQCNDPDGSCEGEACACEEYQNGSFSINWCGGGFCHFSCWYDGGTQEYGGLCS